MSGMFSLPAVAFVMLSMFWGLAFLAIRLAMIGGFLPISFVALRLALAAALMAIGFLFFRFTNPAYFKKMKLPKHFWLKMCAQAFFNNSIPFCAVAIASKRINVGVTSILDSGIPIFAALFAPLLLKNEGLSVYRLSGITTGFLGVVAVCLHKVTDAGDLDEVWIPGYLLVTLACASYGFASVFGVKYLNNVPRFYAAFTQLSWGAIQCLVAAAIIEFNLPITQVYKFPLFLKNMIVGSNTEAIVSLFYVAIFASVCAYVLYFYLLNTIGAVKQALVGYLLPFWGLIAGILYQKEWEGKPFSYIALEILGVVLIIAGIGICNLEKKESKNDDDFDESLLMEEGDSKVNIN
ncbi:hypothetical protein RCL1_000119 [Eukaryota sp. TZLM3-RCL]